MTCGQGFSCPKGSDEFYSDSDCSDGKMGCNRWLRQKASFTAAATTPLLATRLQISEHTLLSGNCDSTLFGMHQQLTPTSICRNFASNTCGANFRHPKRIQLVFQGVMFVHAFTPASFTGRRSVACAAPSSEASRPSRQSEWISSMSGMWRRILAPVFAPFFTMVSQLPQALRPSAGCGPSRAPETAFSEA